MNYELNILTKYDKELLKGVVRTLVEKDKDISKIILFGSRARGDFHEDSDYDILVLSNFEGTSLDKSTSLLSLIRANNIYDYVSILARTPKMFESDGQLRDEILEQGLVLYEESNIRLFDKSTE